MSDLVVFSTGIDNGQYQLLVKRSNINSTHGIVEVYEGEDLIHSEQTVFAYGAIFGPDIDDTYAWSTLALDVIDNPEKRRLHDGEILEDQPKGDLSSG